MKKKRTKGLGVVAIGLFDIAHAIDRLATVEAMKLERQTRVADELDAAADIFRGKPWMAVFHDEFPKEQK